MNTKILNITRHTSNRNAIQMFKDILQLSLVFIPYIALITLTFVTASCTRLDPNTGSMILDIDPGFQINTVLPDINMTPAQYEFHGEGPNSGSFNVNDDQLPVYQRGLEFGEWTITVNVKNIGGIIIAQGSQAATVHNGEVITCQIPIRPVSGHGALDLTVFWNEADIDLPSLHGQLTLDNGAPIDLDFTTINPGHTQCTQESIPTGYHTLIIQLLDNNMHVAGAVEVIRVIDTQTTSAVFEFYDINQPGGDISIILTPQMDEPLDIELAGQEVEILERENMTVTVTVPIDVGTVEYMWYINGEFKDTGETLLIGNNLQPGVYRLDVTAFTSDHRRAGSTMHVFSVFPTDEEPDLTPPAIHVVNPGDMNVDVAATVHVSIKFSEAMDEDSTEAAFTLSNGYNEVSGTFSWSGDTVTFNPSDDLGYSTLYYITVDTGAKDTAGNNMVSDFNSSFTTRVESDWNLIFEDEFNGTSLDTNKWHTGFWWADADLYCTIEPNNELQLYTPWNVIIEDGMLKLRAQEENLVWPFNGELFHYTSGMVMTGGRINKIDPGFTFTYGYAEARIKVPSGQGLWPAFWMMPADYKSKPEIDIMEILGHTPNIYRMHYHHSGGSLGENWDGPDFSQDWHVIAVNWDSDEIVWYVDGVEHFRFEDASAISSEPMYLLLNLAVGGDWPGAPNASTPFPNYSEIDYIRVWSRGN